MVRIMLVVLFSNFTLLFSQTKATKDATEIVSVSEVENTKPTHSGISGKIYVANGAFVYDNKSISEEVEIIHLKKEVTSKRKSDFKNKLSISQKSKKKPIREEKAVVNTFEEPNFLFLEKNQSYFRLGSFKIECGINAPTSSAKKAIKASGMGH